MLHCTLKYVVVHLKYTYSTTHVCYMYVQAVRIIIQPYIAEPIYYGHLGTKHTYVSDLIIKVWFIQGNIYA